MANEGKLSGGAESLWNYCGRIKPGINLGLMWIFTELPGHTKKRKTRHAHISIWLNRKPPNNSLKASVSVSSRKTKTNTTRMNVVIALWVSLTKALQHQVDQIYFSHCHISLNKSQPLSRIQKLYCKASLAISPMNFWAATDTSLVLHIDNYGYKQLVQYFTFNGKSEFQWTWEGTKAIIEKENERH
jgi:hypothetical protein